MKRAYRLTGVFASFLAVLVASGGHWMVFQSVAWTSMLIANARSEPLAVAVRETFDGKHPCKMCHQIREGREDERRESSLAGHDHEPRTWLAMSVASLDLSALRKSALEASASGSPGDFVGAPPEPPPRTA